MFPCYTGSVSHVKELLGETQWRDSCHVVMW